MRKNCSTCIKRDVCCIKKKVQESFDQIVSIKASNPYIGIDLYCKHWYFEQPQIEAQNPILLKLEDRGPKLISSGFEPRYPVKKKDHKKR